MDCAASAVCDLPVLNDVSWLFACIEITGFIPSIAVNKPLSIPALKILSIFFNDYHVSLCRHDKPNKRKAYVVVTLIGKRNLSIISC